MKHFSRVFSGALLCSLAAYAASPAIARADITINEVAWMGTAASQYSEWIELYNDGTDPVSLAGWKLTKGDSETLFALSKTIAARGYLLVERTTASAPDAVPGIDDESGPFGNGGLKNTGDNLVLKEKDGTTADSLLFASGWPAGDAKTKQTMQWNGTKWVSGPGTPDAANAKAAVADVPPSVTPPAATHPAQAQTPAAQSAAVVPTPISAAVTDTAGTSQETPAQSASDSAARQALQAAQAAAAAAVPATGTDTAAPQPSVPEHPARQQAPAKSAAMPASAKKTKKPSSKKGGSSTAATSTATNDSAASELQANAGGAKENNHTKTIVFGAVAFIGMALFLLLERLKASKE